MNLGLRVVLFSLPAFLFLTSNAHAYLDAGTISYVLQFVIAGLVGGLFIIKMYFKKIKSFFTKSEK